MAQGYLCNVGAPATQAPQNYQPQQYAAQIPNGPAAPQWNPNNGRPAPQHELQPGPAPAPSRPTVRQSSNGASKQRKPRVEEAATRDEILPEGPPAIPGVSPKSYSGAHVAASWFGRGNGRSTDTANVTSSPVTYEWGRAHGSQLSPSAGSVRPGLW